MFAAMNRFILFCICILLIGKMAVLTTGCANMIPPDGGPRDSLPPVLVSVTPGDSTRNFTGSRVTFTFDEFIDLPSWRDQVMVSPLGTDIDITAKLNTVTLRLKETPEPNTTYFINFGDAIRDYNEGNVFKNFSYTFSTGPYIDSLELTGNVILAETGKIDTTLIVMLHTNPDDSAVRNQNPRYITRLDSRGNFRFRNLPPKVFYLYALKDETGSRKYFVPTQLFAFADKPVNLTDSTSPVTLYAYNTKATSTTSTTAPVSPGNRVGRNTASADNRLRYQANLVANQQDLLGPLVLTFEQPLQVFDSSKTRFYSDSVYNPVNGYAIKKDSTNRKIVLSFAWKENTSYHLIMEKDFARDSTGKQLLKTDTLSFTTKKLSDYGSLQVKFRNLDMNRNPVLLFVTGENVVKSVPLLSPEFSQALFLPGEYELRILYDNNKNGKWDPGEFFGVHRQPELVKPIDRRINVKAAWQNEYDIEAPR